MGDHIPVLVVFHTVPTSVGPTAHIPFSAEVLEALFMAGVIRSVITIREIIMEALVDSTHISD